MMAYASGKNNLPAPPHVVWDDLVERRAIGTRAWLDLEEDEVAPEILESERHSTVVWSSLWPSRPDDRIRFDLGAVLGGETALSFTVEASVDGPDEATAERVRFRLSRLLYAELRHSYGG